MRAIRSRRRHPADFVLGMTEPPRSFRFGIPQAQDLEFFGNEEAPQLFAAAVRRLEDIGGLAVPIDFAPFREASVLLFDGPWVAERLQAVGAFVADHPNDVLPVTRSIIQSGSRWSAVDAFTAQYRQRRLSGRPSGIFSSIDVLAVPTVATWFTIAELLAEPLKRNSMMGFYSYFVNLLDLCAVAAPSGFYSNGIPAGAYVHRTRLPRRPLRGDRQSLPSDAAKSSIVSGRGIATYAVTVRLRWTHEVARRSNFNGLHLQTCGWAALSLKAISERLQAEQLH